MTRMRHNYLFVAGFRIPQGVSRYYSYCLFCPYLYWNFHEPSITVPPFLLFPDSLTVSVRRSKGSYSLPRRITTVPKDGVAAMNYAEDRLDRRARFEEGDNSLWKDYRHALEVQDDELLARTLRDVGWNRQALFHYARCWYNDPGSEKACGDFAQMAEFAGFPEVGALAILTWRSKDTAMRAPESNGDTLPPTITMENDRDERWLLQSTPPNGDCGCGNQDCGKFDCYFPFGDVENVVNDLREYCDHVGTRHVPTCCQILNFHSGRGKLSHLPEPDIPIRLKFWKNSNQDGLRMLSPLLQMLLVKLLYACIPMLAAEAVCHATIPEHTARQQYKSHHAYWVLIRSVVLGMRIKPHRKQLHTPIWEQLWIPDSVTSSVANMDRSLHFFERLKCIPSWNSLESIPPLCWSVPGHMAAEPIFLVGDSHVLSLAWQIITIDTEKGVLRRQVVPVIITGLKAWHVRKTTRFFTRYNLLKMLHRLPADKSQTILFSAGEIDCREGLGGPQLQGYEHACLDHVQRTVRVYTDALRELAKVTGKQILVLPVAPHGYRKTGRVASQQSRRETMQAWNQELRHTLPLLGVNLLDYVDSLLHPDEEGFILNPAYNADGTHMNSGFGPLLAKAIVGCNCDLSLL